jgi:hypothetical protein
MGYLLSDGSRQDWSKGPDRPSRELNRYLRLLASFCLALALDQLQ